jgi:diguanylate cyclase (GGDEF)-like protein
MIKLLRNRFRNLPLHWRLQLMVAMLLVGVLVLMSVYWKQLEASNTQLRQDTLALADQHAEQLADAVAHQADDLFRGIDTGLRHMGNDYLYDRKSFEESVRTTLSSYPEGTILNISVFDASGVAVYSKVPVSGRVYAGDRDYFRLQAESSADHSHVGQAIMGRVSKAWTIPVSRKLILNGRFAGVVVVFLRADYLNRMLARIARHDGDVVSLFTQEGAYLSRSVDAENVMGKLVPRDRPFIGAAAPRSGVFRVVSPLDQVSRIYGWFRLDDYPLMVNVGLDTRPILAPIEARIAQGRKANVLGSGLILLGLLLIVGLLLHTARQQKRMAEDEAALRISSVAFEAASEGMLVTDAQNRILMVAQELIGQSPGILSSGRQDGDFYAALWRALNANGHWEGEVTNRHKNGQFYIEWLKINVIDKDDPLRRRHVAVISDITERKKGEEVVWRRANYDELTGLPNRRLFDDRLKQSLVHAARNRNSMAVLFIDLDEFKPVNDRYGHQAGDELLKQVASRMTLCLRGEDTVARQGGDEFVVMLATTHTEHDALAVADKLLAALHTPFQIDGDILNIGASIGVALFPRHGETAETLLEKADAAMYAAKAAGRHRVRLYSAEAPESGREVS